MSVDPLSKPISMSVTRRTAPARRLGRLASDCVELLESGDRGQKPCLASVCTAMWPNPSGSDNCAWSRTADANDPNQEVQVCIKNTGGLAHRPVASAHTSPSGEPFASSERCKDSSVFHRDYWRRRGVEPRCASLPERFPTLTFLIDVRPSSTARKLGAPRPSPHQRAV